MYVIDGSNHNIQKFTNALVFSIRTEIDPLSGVVVNSLDKIFVIHFTNDEFEEFDTSLVSQGTTSLNGTDPKFLAIDSSDNVYVSDGTRRK